MRKLLTQSISDIASHELYQVHFFLKTLVFLPFDTQFMRVDAQEDAANEEGSGGAANERKEEKRK